MQSALSKAAVALPEIPDPADFLSPTGYLGPVSESDAPTPAEYAVRLGAAVTREEWLALVREIRERWPVSNETVRNVILDFFFESTGKTPATFQELSDYVRARGELDLTIRRGVVTWTSAVTLGVSVPKPTVLEQYVRLPCGQQLAVLVVFLLVLISFDLPSDVQEKLWGLITELGAAIWVIQRITRKR